MTGVAVLIQRYPGTVPEWFETAVWSVDYGTLVVVDDLDGGHVGKARADGLSACKDYRYAAVLDSDDQLLPGAVQACVEALEAAPDAAFAWTRHELLCEPECPVGTPPLHQAPKSRLDHCDLANHLCVFRTERVLPHLDRIAGYRVMPEHILRALLLRDHPAVFVDRIGYRWRQHLNQTSRKATTDDKIRERRDLAHLRKEIGDRA